MDFSEFWPKEAPPLKEATKFIEKYQNKKIIVFGLSLIHI